MTKLAKEFSIHYLTITDYATKVGISRQAVHKAIQKGKLNAIRIGSYWYVQRGNHAQ